MLNKRLINKVGKKKKDKYCYFCEQSEYIFLEVHRIVEGCQGGEYSEFNSISVCAHCHIKIHAGIIKIDRKYLTTNGKYKLHYFENGEEKWKYPPEN
jgi:hypothetical protein